MAPVIKKIFGGPGTGKTTRLLQILHEEHASGIPLKKIAYIAHTNAAADEAWSRLKGKIDDQKKRPMYFCTMHAAARRKTGWNTKKIWGRTHRDALAEAMGMTFSVWNETNGAGEKVVNAQPLIQCINLSKSAMIPLEIAMENFSRYEVVTWDNLMLLQTHMEAIKKEAGVKDFDDILELYYTDPLPLEAKVMFIDEAQDLSFLQWKIAAQMWADCDRVYICGDDDQAIYSFMGADPDGFLDHPADTEEVLPNSWRVPRVIGEWAERIITPVEKRKVKGIAWAERAGEVEVVQAYSDTLPIDFDSPYTMILCRHQIQVQNVYSALRNQGIAVANLDFSFLTDKEAVVCGIFLDLAEGKTIGISEAIKMLRECPGREESVNRLVEMRGVQDARQTFTREDFDLDYDARFGSVFGLDLREADVYDAIHLQVLRNGRGVLMVPPKINVMTMHASKGREADHVIIMTDCYGSVWNEQETTGQDTERKLAYVAVTRAKRKVTLVEPNSEQYCRYLTETV